MIIIDLEAFCLYNGIICDRGMGKLERMFESGSS